ncbi:MAG: immunoglobulin domain-containing protein [Candidatus Nezhaarchaeales archaeon]
MIASYGDYMLSFDFVYIDEEGTAHGIEGGYLLYVPEGFVYGFANGTVVIYGYAPQSVYPEELWGLAVIEGNYTITEAEPPVITLEPLEIEVEQGSLVTFNCSASYDPNPNGEITSIDWYLNGSLIAHNVEILTLNTSDLSQGIYVVTVEAMSNYGTKWSEQSILRIYIPKRVLTTIILTTSQSRVEVGSEMTFTITCLDQENKPLAGLKVEVHVNDVLIGVTQPTNNEGQATLSYTFQAEGEYTVKAIHGEIKSNEVKVTVEEIAKLDIYIYIALGVVALIIIAIVIMKLR